VEVAARWADVVQRPEWEVPLDEAALLISAAARPALDVDAQLGRLDDLAARVAPRDPVSLNHVLFTEIGLRGDRDGYYQPVNSYLDRVLDRCLGIPITLAVLLIEVGRRADVSLEAVGMPGHFLVRDPARPEVLLDPFDEGRSLDMAGCERLLRQTTGTTTRLTPDMLAPTGPHAVLARMLSNLDRAFEMRQDRRSLSWVCDLRLALPALALGDRTQLAGRLASLGRLDAAASVLEQVAGAVTSDRVRARLTEQAATFRARLN
jgi:regulator of sirC expression with transglutaminase-like and TPR domain